MSAYSKGRSLKVLDAVGHGVPRKEVLGVFNVSLTTMKHWLKHRNEGSPGWPPTILATAEEKRALWEQLESNAEATQERQCELWEKRHGVRVSLATVCRAIRPKLGWTSKKDAGCLLRTRRRVERCLVRAPERRNPKWFDFVDECSTNFRMISLGARAVRAKGLLARRLGTGRRT